MTPTILCEEWWWKLVGFSWETICGPSGSEIDMITTWQHCMSWHSFYVLEEWTWVTYISNVLSIKTILFDILDFWCQLVVIRFVKTLSKRRMFVLFMKISACWLLHRLIKFNKICWEKRPAKPRPNLRTSFCRRDLKNTQPHLNGEIQKLNFQRSGRTIVVSLEPICPTNLDHYLGGYRDSARLLGESCLKTMISIHNNNWK